MNSEFYKNIVFKIICGDEKGTGFLIKPNLLLTASHVLTDYCDNCDIIIYNDNIDCEEIKIVSVIEGWKNNDLAIIKISTEFDIKSIPISEENLTEDKNVKSYGYLGESNNIINVLFNISDVKTCTDNSIDNINLVLKPSSDERVVNFEGLSGSPVIYNNYIVGVIIRQCLQNNTVYRLNAIVGIQFRRLIRDYEIDLDIINDLSNSDQTNHNILSELDYLQSAKFNSIQNQLISGNSVDSLENLREFMLTIESSNNSDEKKSKYYYTASIHEMSANNFSLAEDYFNKAISLNLELDTRLYLAYKQIFNNKYDEAKKILHPINNEDIFNAYLVCLLNTDRDIIQAQECLTISRIKPNTYTYRIFALIELKDRKFSSAIEFIDKAIEFEPQNSDFKIIKALIFYKQSIKDILVENDRYEFVICNNIQFYPTLEQTLLLEKALAILQELLKVVKEKSLLSRIIVIYLAVISLIPGKDINLIIDDLWKNCYWEPNLILFCIDRDITIPKDIVEKFLKFKYSKENIEIYTRAKVALYIKNKNYEKAEQIYDSYNNQFLGLSDIQKKRNNIIFSLYCNKLIEAENLLRDYKLDDDFKMRTNIVILEKKDMPSKNMVINLSLNLAKKTKLSQDFSNANYLCMKYRNYSKMYTNAKLWYKTTKETIAQTYIAEALYREYNYNKALKEIDKISKSSNLSNVLKNIKLDCLVGLSRYKEAIEYSNTFEYLISNPKLVIFQANSYISLGQKEKAIAILRNFAESQIDKDVYIYLIDLLKNDFPDDAYEYAYKLYMQYPNDKEIIRFVGYIGILTNHNNLYNKYNKILQKDLKEGKNIKSLTFKEMKKYILENSERSEKVINQYLNAEIPIHVTVDGIHNILGGMLYNQWNQYIGMLSNFCSSPISKEIKNNNILLDYTMCISVIELDLLDKLREMFKYIWISNKTIALITQDVEELKNNQQFIVNRNRLLFNKLKKVNLNIIDDTKYKDIDIGEYDRNDVIDLMSAKELSAWVVNENPSSNITGDKVLSEWYNNQLTPNELYALINKLQLASIEYDKNKVRENVINMIKINSNLIMNSLMLEEIMEKDLLDCIFTYFKVYITQNNFSVFEREIEKYNYNDNASNWLSGISEKLSKLVERDIIKIAPTTNIDKKCNMKYSGYLEDEFSIALNNHYNFGIDDRMLNKYNNIAENDKWVSNIYNIMDLINTMFTTNIIDKNRYFSLLDKLIKNRYSFFVPPADYLYNRLKYSQIDSENYIVENNILLEIRKSIAYALYEKTGVSITICKDNIPEVTSYMINLLRTFNDVMKFIWLDSEKDNKWKEASSNWVLMTMGDYLCDIKKVKHNAESFRAQKYFELIGFVFNIWEDKLALKSYVNWLFSYIYWSVEPNLLNDVTSYFAKLLSSVIEENNLIIDGTGYELSVVKSAIVENLFNVLPSEFMYYVYQQEEMKDCKNWIAVDWQPSRKIDKTRIDCDINFDNVLKMNEDTFEDIIVYVCSNPEENGLKVLTILDDDNFKKIQKDDRYRFARFLFDLSWYLPSNLQSIVHEKKRFLAILVD